MTDQQHDRAAFRDAVFARDGYRCVLCGQEAQDAHHLLERRLFDDGGYQADNGVSLCAEHHLAAERTEVSPDELRVAAGITEVVLPGHLSGDTRYTKWGDEELPDGTISPGELFGDESVQKVLREAGKLERYRTWYKYPRTPHLPTSPGRSSDDLSLGDIGDFFDDGEPVSVVVTEKLDGENTNLYRDGLHARSLSGVATVGQSRVRALWAEICADIPAGWRVCGENVTVRHSVAYLELSASFYVFSIFDASNTALSWNDTVQWCALLGLEAVPVLYEGPFDLTEMHDAWASRCDEHSSEGYVVRRRDAFSYRDFRRSVAKWVRANHVTTDRHWRHGPLVENPIVASGDTPHSCWDDDKT